MKKWTKDEDELLTACCAMSWFYKDIANELGRGYSSVLHRAHRIKVSNNKAETKTHKKYIEELKEKCATVLCLEEYKGAHTKILHKCLKCGSIYKSMPASKLQGYACMYCGTNNNSSGIPQDKEGITYLVYIPKYDLYKIGITSKTVKERMRDNNIRYSDYELILEHKFDKGIDAIKLEKKWKENLKDYLINTGLLRTGNTETFRI